MKTNVVWLFAFATLSACDGTERTESENLFHVIERFRVAENRDKPGLVKAIEDAPATSAGVGPAKAKCAFAAKQLSKAVSISNEVDVTLGQIEKDGKGKSDPRAEPLGRRLDEAEALLKEGHLAMQECETSLTPLRKKYAR